jgi:acetyl esterase/lipase
MKYLSLLFVLMISSCASFKGAGEFDKKEKFSYMSDTSERHMAEAFIPKGAGPFPGVIVVHGGGWRTGSLEDVRSIAKSLASHGYTVMTINYRFSPKDKHPAPIEDLEQALIHFKKNAPEYKLDTKQIGLWGYSSGAHTVAYYAYSKNDSENKVQAVVAGGGPYDLTWYPHSPYINDYIGKYRDDAIDEYFAASVTGLVKPGLPPTFLYHSVNDKLLEYTQCTALEAKLEQAHVKVKRYAIGYWGHATGFIFSNEAVKKGILFLKDVLPNASSKIR